MENLNRYLYDVLVDIVLDYLITNKSYRKIWECRKWCHNKTFIYSGNHYTYYYDGHKILGYNLDIDIQKGIGDIFINNNGFYILDRNAKFIQIYSSFDYKLIKTIKIHNHKKGNHRNQIYVDDENNIYVLRYKYDLVKYYNNGKVRTIINDRWKEYTSMQIYGSNIYLVCDNIIYTINKDKYDMNGCGGVRKYLELHNTIITYSFNWLNDIIVYTDKIVIINKKRWSEDVEIKINDITYARIYEDKIYLIKDNVEVGVYE